MLRELAAEGYPDAEIADELNERFGTERKAPAVCVHRRRAGIPTLSRPGNSPDPVRRSQILTLLADGRTLNWIARRMNVSQQSVNEIVAKLVTQGVVRRTGGQTRNVRYVPTLKWVRDEGGE